MITIPTTSWADDLQLLDGQTELLLASVASLDDGGVREPSALPGWTRGHVLAHLDGNAQGLGRLARWATDGIERPMYISSEVRNADVDLRAGRDARSHESALAQSARAIREDLGRLTPQRRDVDVVLGNGMALRAGALARHRLQEVCVHHADLGLSGYTWQDWPAAMATHMIRLVARDFADRGEFPVARVAFDDEEITIVPGDTVVAGTPQEILAWLLGRASGEGLREAGGMHIPAAPRWR